jgi:hypothetical protein
LIAADRRSATFVTHEREVRLWHVAAVLMSL